MFFAFSIWEYFVWFPALQPFSCFWGISRYLWFRYVTKQLYVWLSPSAPRDAQVTLEPARGEKWGEETGLHQALRDFFPSEQWFNKKCHHPEVGGGRQLKGFFIFQHWTLGKSWIDWEIIQFDKHIFQLGWFNHQLAWLWMLQRKVMNQLPDLDI